MPGLEQSLGMQGAQGQDLADDLPAGAIGLEHLKQEAKERAAHGINAFAAVGPLVGLGQESGRQERSKQQVQLEQAVLADLPDALAEAGEAGAPGGKQWSAGMTSIYTCQWLDVNVKMPS